MVNVSDKAVTMRSATAQGRIFIPKIAYDLIQNSRESQENIDADSELSQRREKTRAKGDVLTVARLAGIMSGYSSTLCKASSHACFPSAKELPN